MPQNLSARIVCPSPKVWDLDEKRFHWDSVVHGLRDCMYAYFYIKIENVLHFAYVNVHESKHSTQFKCDYYLLSSFTAPNFIFIQTFFVKANWQLKQI